MKKMYEVIYKTYVIAEDRQEAEQMARDTNLTIQDDSIKADLVKPILESKLIKTAEKIIYNLFQIPGMNADKAEVILKESFKDLEYNITPEQFNVLYNHCERMVIYDEEE